MAPVKPNPSISNTRRHRQLAGHDLKGTVASIGLFGGFGIFEADHAAMKRLLGYCRLTCDSSTKADFRSKDPMQLSRAECFSPSLGTSGNFVPMWV